MAKIFHIKRADNEIILGTTDTLIEMTGRSTLTGINTLAAGLSFQRVTCLQTDATALTGTLRGAYIDVSNGALAATGTIRAMELKARTEAPGDTGNDVAVLEGLSISVDSKGHNVTTMRAAEFILDGKTAGTIDEAVGLRIANNLQIDKATISYGLQIYRDSFDYTADIQLSNGAMIGTENSAALCLKLSPSGSVGIKLPAGVEPSASLTIGSTIGTEEFQFYHTGTHAFITTSTGNIRVITKSTVDKNTYLGIYGNGTPGVGYLSLYDQDGAETFQFRCSSGHGYVKTTGVAPGPIHLQDSAHSSVRLFANAAEGETKELMIYGHRTGDASRRILEIGVGIDADDTASFDGVSNYYFDGRVGIGTASPDDELTVKGDGARINISSADFENIVMGNRGVAALDTAYAMFKVGGVNTIVLDTAGNSYFNGGNVGIGTTAPNAPLEVKGAKPGVVGGFQSGQLQVTGTGGEFYCAVITGHNAFNGNTQLWYLGNTSSSSHNDIAFINRQNAAMHFYTNNTSRMTIEAAGNVGIGVADPHSKLEVNGAISSATLIFSTEGPTDDVDVSGINTLFLDTASNSITIGGFAGGVDGQVLYVLRISNANNAIIEHNEAEATQKIFLHAGADETLGAEYGGWIFICHGGTDWHDASHAKHVP